MSISQASGILSLCWLQRHLVVSSSSWGLLRSSSISNDGIFPEKWTIQFRYPQTIQFRYPHFQQAPISCYQADCWPSSLVTRQGIAIALGEVGAKVFASCRGRLIQCQLPRAIFLDVSRLEPTLRGEITHQKYPCIVLHSIYRSRTLPPHKFRSTPQLVNRVSNRLIPFLIRICYWIACIQAMALRFSWVKCYMSIASNFGIEATNVDDVWMQTRSSKTKRSPTGERLCWFNPFFPSFKPTILLYSSCQLPWKIHEKTIETSIESSIINHHQSYSLQQKRPFCG